MSNAQFSMTEGTGFDMDFTLRAGANFKGLTEGDIITRSLLNRVWIYIQRPVDEEPIITKSDKGGDPLSDTETEIEWTDEEQGELTVYLVEEDTKEKPGVDSTYEMWGELASNDEPVLLDKGIIDINDSIKHPVPAEE